MPFAKPAKAPVNTPAVPRLAAQQSFDAVEVEEESQVDVETQLSQATQFGHSLASLQPIQRQVGAVSEVDEEEETPIQAKLTIGQPGDKYEQEADRMAAKVMAMPDSAVQRETMPEEDDELQMRQQLQRQTLPEEEDETLQAKSQIQAKGTDPRVPTNFDNQLAQHKGSGQPLSDETRAFMEPRFGWDFSNVRVHETPDLANAIQAQAFTHGQDIYFNSGKYNPGSSRGKELLAHELTHTIQQTVTSLQKRASARRESSYKKPTGKTYWEWYRSNDPEEGEGYKRLTKTLKKQFGYKFYQRVAIFTKANGKKIWNKEVSPENTTLADDVAWRISLPGGDWSWATTSNIVSKCQIWFEKSISDVNFSEDYLEEDSIRGGILSSLYSDAQTIDDSSDLRKAEKELEEIERKLIREYVKTGLDALGIIDPSPASDLASATMSFEDGEYWDAGLSLISMIPYIGDFVGKPLKVARVARKIKFLTTRISALLRKIRRLKRKGRSRPSPYNRDRQGVVWRQPQSLAEQLAMKAAKSGEGIFIRSGPFRDPKFQDPGWEKWSYSTYTADGNKIEIHYMKNTITGQTDQFKFLSRGEYRKPKKT